jgi:hypothetical protein
VLEAGHCSRKQNRRLSPDKSKQLTSLNAVDQVLLSTSRAFVMRGVVAFLKMRFTILGSSYWDTLTGVPSPLDSEKWVDTAGVA